MDVGSAVLGGPRVGPAAEATLVVEHASVSTRPAHRRVPPLAGAGDGVDRRHGLHLLVLALAFAPVFPLLALSLGGGLGCGLGGCIASIPAERWASLYRLAEKKGEHVRLDWSEGPDGSPPTALKDERGTAARIALSCPWTVCLRLKPDESRSHQQHINVLVLFLLQ